jgi:DNA-binding NarL/FixJ family response regulator
MQLIEQRLETSPTPVTDGEGVPDGRGIRVVVFEATRMNSELLSRALESSNCGIRVVGTYTSSAVPSTPLDGEICVISSHLREGEIAGFGLLRRLRTSNPSLQCVMLLERDDKELVIEAFRSGAMGVCEREQSYELLCKCIYSVHAGQVWANSRQLRYILQALTAPAPAHLTNLQGHLLLTRREGQIVSLVVEGLKNREIAELLKVSQHTVKNHLFRVFDKLGISSRAELILRLFGHQNSADGKEP